MCGPTDDELLEYVFIILEHNREARLRGGNKDACRVCVANLMYLAKKSSGTLGSITRSLLEAGGTIGIDGHTSGIGDGPCLDTLYSLMYFTGQDMSDEARKAYERHIPEIYRR